MKEFYDNKSDTKETLQQWENLAAWWDKQIADGDLFQRHMIFPNILKLLQPKRTDVILDIGCGNGVLSRLLSKKSHKIIGIDFSRKMLALAQKKQPQTTLNIVVLM